MNDGIIFEQNIYILTEKSIKVYKKNHDFKKFLQIIRILNIFSNFRFKKDLIEYILILYIFLKSLQS